jgi:hypothetical protein
MGHGDWILVQALLCFVEAMIAGDFVMNLWILSRDIWEEGVYDCAGLVGGGGSITRVFFILSSTATNGNHRTWDKHGR